MSESHDLWEDARTATREDVHRIFAPHERTCPSCGKTSEVVGSLCPHCRAPYTVREKGFRVTPERVGIVVCAVALLVIGALIAVPGLRKDAADGRRERAAEQARFDAAENVRIAREQRPIRAEGPQRRDGEGMIALRTRQVRAGEAAIVADAHARKAAGEMDDPVTGVQCRPFPGTDTRLALEADPATAKGRYECYAYERRVDLPELNGKARTGLLGFPYWLVIDYETSGMAFCKIVPRAGEASFNVNFVVVPEPCRDPNR
jgi:hypothetical protein